MTMQAGKITAKLRDAVPVRFMENGEEKAQYRNIDIPDSLKLLEIKNFRFDVPEDGKISFQLFFAPGVLPEVFPEARAKMTRAEKAAKVVVQPEAEALEEAKTVVIEVVRDTIIAAGGTTDVIVNIAAPINADAPAQAEEIQPATDETLEIAYNVTGDRRKELVNAIGMFLGWQPLYKGAPSFAFAIDEYTVDKNGTLTGKYDQELLDALAAQGFTAA